MVRSHHFWLLGHMFWCVPSWNPAFMMEAALATWRWQRQDFLLTALLIFKLRASTDCQAYQFSSVQFSRSVVSDSSRPHESQHARPPCPSPAPGIHSDSCPLSRWCHPAISSSAIPFSSCSQSFPVSESFQMSQLFVKRNSKASWWKWKWRVKNLA